MVRILNNSSNSTTQLVYEETEPIISISRAVDFETGIPCVLPIRANNVSNEVPLVLRLRSNDFYNKILDSPPEAFATFTNESQVVILEDLTESIQQENVNFSNMLLSKLNPQIISNTSEFSLLPDNARILDWDDRARKQIARSICSLTGQNGESIESVSSQLPNLTEYGRILGGHFNRIGISQENLVTHISSATPIIPEHMVGALGNPIFDHSLFVFLEQTSELSISLVQASLLYFNFTNTVSIVAFAFFFSPVFLSLSDFTLRKITRSGLTMSGFFDRIRNTFITFQNVRNFQINLPTLRRFDPKIIITDLQRNMKEGFKKLTSLSGAESGIQSKIFSFLNKYSLNIIFGGITSLGIFLIRKELLILAKKLFVQISSNGDSPPVNPKPLSVMFIKMLIDWYKQF